MQFALRILRFSGSLSGSVEGQMIRRQLVRSGTSPGAQYREAQRSRSDAEYISKMESATQELEETAYWLELAERSGLTGPGAIFAELRQEVGELTAIFVACTLRAKRNK